MAKQSAPELVQQALTSLRETLFTELDMGGLHTRNPTAHKWKAPYRSLQLREAVYWRMQDLLAQSFLLHQHGHGLGARILLRSAFETLAMLIYLNQRMAKVLDGTLAFLTFSEETEKLMLGSRDGSTPVTAVNILTVLDKCDAKYAGIRKMYDQLSESAHPNHEGMSEGYTKIDHAADTILFSNRWMDLHGERHLDSVMLCVEIFGHEYNDVWDDLFCKLETWIEANHADLEVQLAAKKAQVAPGA